MQEKIEEYTEEEQRSIDNMVHIVSGGRLENPIGDIFSFSGLEMIENGDQVSVYSELDMSDFSVYISPEEEEISNLKDLILELQEEIRALNSKGV